ncbi:hypothetical protein AOC36_09530 [Erysipelothrix larvae]|uniref:Uncharacterized protein n=1 Tax=Erysipelothrix larvae TaxID=1514105 RepID=A0A0X8H1N8_9FIRM|nr:hypothetical protein [Erysipelothrix larvae]AMC94214.1 hypothetical protein AOC36_09530 [Erysipelothrix larvae]
MKKFKLNDLFLLARVIEDLGLQDDLKAIFDQAGSVLKNFEPNIDDSVPEEEREELIKQQANVLVDQAQSETIASLIRLLIKNIQKSKGSVAELIGSIMCVTPDEALLLGIGEIIAGFKEALASENLSEIFQSAVGTQLN